MRLFILSALVVRLVTAHEGDLEKFNKDLQSQYLKDIGLKGDYNFENGKRIKVLAPVETTPQGVFIIGAYPSAVFKREGRRTVPVDNLKKPFDDTCYPDDHGGCTKNKSGIELEQRYLVPLGISRKQCWITNLVKVFLYKKGHSEEKISERKNYLYFAEKSMELWIKREIEIANPKIVITLGCEVAQTIRGIKGNPKCDELLDYKIGKIQIKGKEYPIVHMVHPGLLMRTSKDDRASKLNDWGKRHMEGLKNLKPQVRQLLN